MNAAVVRLHLRVTACTAAIFSCTLALASDHLAQAGLTDLADRIGVENLPTGESVHVAQVEAMENGNYRPDEHDPQFGHTNFHWMSGESATSQHATLVGHILFGSQDALVPGIPNVYAYKATGFLGDHWLQTGAAATVPPHDPPGNVKIVNHSWGGVFFPNYTNFALRRSDFVVDHHDVLMVVGASNGQWQGHWPMMRDGFNSIAVGRPSGDHDISTTHPQIDVPGRMKPEMVAPGEFTSYTTPLVSSAAALLVDVARTDPTLKSNAAAERAEVIKAILMTGAVHHGAWTNNPVVDGPDRGRTTQPIDEVFGTGMLNIDRSHMILTGNQHHGSSRMPREVISHAGWDRPTVPTGEDRYWRFELPAGVDEVSIVATWNRRVNPLDMDDWAIGHFELELWQLDDGVPQTLLGSHGVDVFEEGNVLSESLIDNVQHLYLRGLAAGEYLLELRRVDSLVEPWPAAVAWWWPPPSVVGDLNGDGVVDVSDLLILLAAWGQCPLGDCPADINGDGAVDVSDLLILLSNWG